jgi:hypothetical protein
MDPVTADTIVQLIRTNAWIPLLALVVGALVRFTKSNTGREIFNMYTKPEHRPLWAMVLAMVGAALDRLATGGTWYDAIAGGVVAGALAIAGHEIIVNTFRKGRDIGEKKQPTAPPGDWDDDSLRPPPPTTITPPMKLAAALVVAALAGCGAGPVVCKVIDLASDVCPLVIVRFADGGTVAVPREEVAALAMRVSAARARADAGVDPDGATP